MKIDTHQGERDKAKRRMMNNAGPPETSVQARGGDGGCSSCRLKIGKYKM